MSDQMFLEDYQEVFQYQLTEDTENKQKGFYIRGIVSKAGEVNKNKRIYPLKVMEEAINSLQEDVKNGGFVGELDHPCLGDSSFSVLSKDGWKEFLDLKIGDEVATLNENNEIVYQQIESIINEPHKGKIYHFNGRNIDVLFTGTHRLYLENRYGKREIVTVKEVFNNRNKYNHHKIIKSGNWIGEERDSITIGKSSYKIKSFMSFIGFWLAEGCVDTSKKGVIIISQNEGTVSDEFRKVLLDLFGENGWKEYSRKRRDNINIGFYIRNSDLYEYLSKLGNCYSKYIPTELKNLSAPLLEELLDWYIKGDGRDQRHYEGSNRRNLFSVSKRLVEDLHELVIKTGGSGNWTEYETEEDYMFADHLIESANKSKLYQLNLSTTKGIYLDERFLEITEEDFDNNVYCITVPNGNFYMKHKNKSYWTGNSSPKINVNKISHKITKLEMAPDGAVLAEMVVLDTSEGRELKKLIEGGVRLGVSTRALGGVRQASNLGEGVVEVLPGLKMKAIDVVFEPSAGDSGRPDFVTESINYNIYKEPIVFKSVMNDVFGDIL